ncbi:MAG: rRNA maturation RNase YbeY [Bacteroidetes bacterium]|nr:rRNA maturation RNase YbeY [Bacteroidota bacterium]
MSARINFFLENVSYVVKKKAGLREWINTTIRQEGKAAGDINFIFCNDDYLLDLNIKYLKHNTLTDILTFSSGSDKTVSGDIFISLPRVWENAVIFDQTMEEELHRVMIHGILHLTGYSDSTVQEKLMMREKENYYLAALKAS